MKPSVFVFLHPDIPLAMTCPMSMRPSVRTVLPPVAGRQRSGGQLRARAHGVLQKYHACLVPPPPFVLLGGSSLLCLGTLILCIAAPQASGQTNASTVAIIEAEGRVEASHPEFTLWETGPRPYTVLPGDRVRTGERSRAVIRFTPQSTLRLGEFSLIEIPRPEEQGTGFSLRRGLLYFFHRDKPTTLPIRTPTAAAVIRGTEFMLQVGDAGETTLSVLNGQVDLFNDLGQIHLESGEEGVASQGQPPRKSPVLAGYPGVQWASYYPGILDLSELELTPAERSPLQDSLHAYEKGNLQQALSALPQAREPIGAGEEVYRAALLLSVGKVSESQSRLTRLEQNATLPPPLRALAGALRKVIAAVLHQPWSDGPPLRLRTEWMAESYYQQSQGRLGPAREAARAAAGSDGFGFGWARLAELEFSFGKTPQALLALNQALRAMPENAQVFALRGFLLAARNDIPGARKAFNRAIALDGALGNAWLGRGLCSLRQGRIAEGRDDLQVACTLEPQRSVLRSYLGKAFALIPDTAHAFQELQLARDLDPGDPTPWLYQALLLEQENRINEAIESLEHSKDLNQQRHVYRSRLLLDQDRAVRGANLAAIYRDAAMHEVGVREAVKAVEDDDANYSAHQFLANSYDALRDRNQVTLRYETAWFSEYLIANLLAPPGAGTLSPTVTQMEYSRLFEHDRLGFASSTEYRSSGEWLQSAAQHGTLGNSAYSAEMSYRTAGGYRANDDLEQLSSTIRFKQQLSPGNGVYLQAIYYDASSGDLAPYFDPAQANKGLRMTERQEPMILAGYHHEWSPGSHSLLLVGRLSDRLTVRNPQQETLLLDTSLGPIPDVVPVSFLHDYSSELEIYTAEAQHLWRQNRHGFVIGGRYQRGDFSTSSRQQAQLFGFLNVDQKSSFEPSMERISGYGYYHFHPVDELMLVAGISADRLLYPDQFRYAPLAETESRRERLSPKAGLVWSPTPRTTFRGAYLRALSGVSLDQSVQIEPSQVAGFTQSLRGLIPEGITGANSAAPLEIAGISVEQRLGKATYVGAEGQRLSSAVDRRFGVFEWLPGLGTSSSRQRLDYLEWAARSWIYQRLDRDWTLGLSYRLSAAKLETDFPDIPATAPGAPPRQIQDATTHHLNGFVVLNHPSGFFAEWDAAWIRQSTAGSQPALSGESLWQFDVSGGYRFARRRAELRIGLLNVTDQDYRLSPLGWSDPIAHERTVFVGFRFAF